MPRYLSGPTRWYRYLKTPGLQLNRESEIATGLLWGGLVDTNAGGKLRDITGFGHDAAAASTVAYQPGGPIGIAASIPASTATNPITGNFTNAATTNAFSLALWLNLSATGFTNQQILSLGLSGSRQTININSGTVRVSALDASSTAHTVAATISTNKWYRVVATQDPAAALAKIYTNGVFVSSVASSATLKSSLGPVALGANFAAIFRYDLPLYWNRALNAGEVLADYQEPLILFRPSALRRYWVVSADIVTPPHPTIVSHAVQRAAVR